MAFSFFPALCDHPQNIKFSDQGPNEVIELLLRQHWVTNLGWILSSIIGFLLPTILLRLNSSFNLFPITSVPLSIQAAGLLIWYLLVFAYTVESFLAWYFNIYIITTERIIDIKLNNLLNRSIIETQIEEVESISTRILGILGEVFNFGNINVETAAKGQEIQFKAIPKPDFVADRLSKMKEALGGEKD